jgi:hypothetical protein
MTTESSTPEIAVEQPAITPEAPPIDEIEQAATKFTMLLPYVKKLGAAMPSQKGMIRVLSAFMEFPLGKEKPKFLTEGERQFFHVLQELQQHKSTVLQAIMKKNYEMEVLEQEARRNADAQLTATELPVAETENTNVSN